MNRTYLRIAGAAQSILAFMSRTKLTRGLLLVATLFGLASCFNGDTSKALDFVSCAQGDECPQGGVCARAREGDALGFCRPATAPCIDVIGRDALAQRDGNGCGGDNICVAGSCVAPRCGDGVLSAGETCDDGVLNSDSAADACRTSCAPANCGDGVRDTGEACDDGPANDDAAPDACRSTCVRAGCGDGVIDSGEGCDDGADNTDAPNACRPDCQPHRCGDGVLDDDEECDDGEGNDNQTPDACRVLCVLPDCGDGVIDDGEVCDGPNPQSGDACRVDCGKYEVCGDGIVDANEACDDGNDNPADGCDACLEQTWDRTLLVSGQRDGVRAQDVRLVRPSAVVVDGLGRAYVADTGNNLVRRIELDGTMTAIAGTGIAGFSGDGGVASSAQLNGPTALAVDNDGALYIADTNNHRIRRVRGDGTIETIAGRGPSLCTMTGEDCSVLLRCSRFNLCASQFQCSTSGESCSDASECHGTCGSSGSCSDSGNFCTSDSDCAPGCFDLGHCASSFFECSSDSNCGESEACIFESVCQNDSGRSCGSCDIPACQTSATCLESGDSCVVDSDCPGTCSRQSSCSLDGNPCLFISQCAQPVCSGPPGGFIEDGPALDAPLALPEGVAVDGQGNVIIADTGHDLIRRVTFDDEGIGSISTLIDGRFGSLEAPTGVAIDALGRIVVVDPGNHRINRIGVDGSLEIIGGSGFGRCSHGDTAFCTSDSDCVGECSSNVCGGTSDPCVTDDDCPPATCGAAAPTAAGLFLEAPYGIALDPAGSLFVSDQGRSVVHKIEAPLGPSAAVVSIAGSGAPGFEGDGGPAEEAQLNGVRGIAIDGAGDLWFADTLNAVIRRVTGGSGSGTIATVGGSNGAQPDAELGMANTVPLAPITDAAVDAQGRIFATDEDQRLFRIDERGLLTQARFGPGPFFTVPRIDVDASGTLYIADAPSNRVFRAVMAADGSASLIHVAGNSSSQFSDGPALATGVNRPVAVAVAPSGDVFIAERDGHRIRRLSFDDDGNGFLTTVAGNGQPGFAEGDPLSRCLDTPLDIALDPNGRLLITDTGNNRIRRITFGEAGPDTIETIAGDGSGVFGGEGVLATASGFPLPNGIAVDDAGDVYFGSGARIFVVRFDEDPRGIVRTFAGGGRKVPNDGEPATGTFFGIPQVLCTDSRGAVLAVDPNLGRGLRKVRLDALGVVSITSVAGDIHPPGPARLDRAQLYPSRAMASVGENLLSVDDLRRGVEIDFADDVLRVVIGHDPPVATSLAAFASIERPRGVAFDAIHNQLVITDAANGDLHAIDVDLDGDGTINDADDWVDQVVPTTLLSPAGIVFDKTAETFVVAEQDNHCVRALGADLSVGEPVAGVCGSPGSFPGFLRSPTHVAVSPTTGALYISDTGNQRVLRKEPGRAATVVIGDGSTSSAGTGRPAREFPVNAPGQLALDDSGNLFVTSTTTIREIANVDGDGDADGDDLVLTIFGGGERASYPETAASCMSSLVVSDDHVYAADACRGFVVDLSRSVVR